MDDPKPASSDKNEQDTSSDLPNKPYDDKQPETYVTPTGEPTSIAPMATPLSLQKPKSHSGRWLFRGLVVLLIAVLGALAYWQYTEAQSASNERASLQSELETVKNAKKESVVRNDEDSVSVNETSAADEIEFEVKSHLAAAVGVKYEFDSGSIVTKEKFATATASLPNAEAPVKIFVLEIVGNEWIVLFTGEKGKVEPAQKESLNKEFGVPVSMLE